MTTSPLRDLRPGKVIAVHLNYRSRAEQRGRFPSFPSYFLKPTTSVSGSGSIERPDGTELLAFEGEIAIIIGRPARRVTLEQARAAIAGVTAANDFGLYDLRGADRGSNLRSKGGDGYTPLGPAQLRAEGLDLRALRVRTWVNGELVQEDTTDGLLFPFEQLVADLSQMITLEPGDVILTGTPAGSSVVRPGDVVEIEVDAPSLTGSPSTGRLVTTVTQGHVPFHDFGEKPSADDHQRREAWGRTGAPVEPEPDWAGLTRDVGTAGISAELRRRGHIDVFLDGLTCPRPGVRMAGPARTLRMIAFRPDLFSAHGGGYNAQKRAFDALGPGDVLVIEARGESRAATVGDVLALRAQTLGAAGIVTDGCVRDSAAVADIGLPVFAQGAHPSVLGRHHVPWETDTTITCAGAAVQVGDVIVGDEDGVLVIPRAIAVDVIAQAARQEAEDAFVAEQVRKGEPVDGLFPMNAAWRARYEAQARPDH